jgi:hypothetical protein
LLHFWRFFRRSSIPSASCHAWLATIFAVRPAVAFLFPRPNTIFISALQGGDFSLVPVSDLSDSLSFLSRSQATDRIVRS